MEKKYKIQILICVVIIVCLIASGYIAPYFMYDQNDVAAVYRLIAENNLDYPKYQPSKWDFVNWAQRENEPLKAHGIHFHSWTIWSISGMKVARWKHSFYQPVLRLYVAGRVF